MQIGALNYKSNLICTLQHLKNVFYAKFTSIPFNEHTYIYFWSLRPHIYHSLKQIIHIFKII